MTKTIAAVATLAIAGAAAADSVTTTYNIDGIDSGPILSDTISLPAIDSLDSVDIDLAHTWGADLVITLTAPNGDIFDIMNNNAAGGTNNYDMGVVAADASLANVATYSFVGSGGVALTDAVLVGGLLEAGTYNANVWNTGGYDAGDWTFAIEDTAAGDPTSVGDVTINYTIPAPGAIALLGLAGLAGTRRRRG